MNTSEYSLKFSIVTGAIRLYAPGKSYENRDEYDGIMSIHFLTDTKAYIFGAHGNITRDLYERGLRILYENGIREIVYERRGKLLSKEIRFE